MNIQTQPLTDFTKLNVLVVDDAQSMRMLLRGYLEELGVTQIVEAKDGSAAIEQLTMRIGLPATVTGINRPFDLVITDWKMPFTNGNQLINFIRKTLGDPQPKILMVTSEGQMKDVIEALESGANGYLLKPFSRDQLLAKLSNVLLAEKAST